MLLGVSVPLSAAHAQGYRLRLDSRVQSVAFRGVSEDSIPVAAVVVGSNGGTETSTGFAVRCTIGSPYCFYFRPGPALHAGPFVTSADLSMWGFGVPGLSAHVNTRAATDFGTSAIWPGTAPTLQLLEGYADYSSEHLTGRLGRQIQTGRLGYTGFDGGRISVRDAGWGLEANGYLGLGLAQATALPVTSAVLNPLDEFQPGRRQIVAGATVGWIGNLGDATLEYQRQVDRRSRYFVSDRASLSANLRPVQHLTVTVGVDYDIAAANWGSADATVRYFTRWWGATAGVQQYRPHFDLWTIWGAFSPVGYHAVNGSFQVTPTSRLQLSARGTRFWFEDTETDTPLLNVEDRGWRFSLLASYQIVPALGIDLGHDAEYGPGASYLGYNGRITWTPQRALMIAVHGSTLDRPLEFRFDEARLHEFGIDARWQIQERWSLSAGIARYAELRKRPDPAALNWNQTRLNAGVTLLLGNSADALRLPKGRLPILPQAVQP
ncbi:MAG: hypothetical protein ABJD11_10900 [Gemmatimonadota bacterium]